MLSFRSRPTPPTRRLPLPAAVAHELWSRVDGPRLDRWLGDAEVVHGTNYVVPPTRRPAVVSVYDCWFLTHPEQAAPAVRRAGEVLRRRVRAGATVHASSHATASAVRDVLGAERVEVIHLGPLAVPAAAPARPPSPWAAALDGRPFVLALGTLERRKDVPTLVRGVRCHRRRPPRRPAGHRRRARATTSAAVDAAVDALDPVARRAVVRPGSVDDATKSWLLHHARVLAYPSLDEGFGFPILEAQQVGLPVVATRAGSIPEVAGDGAALVPVGDPDALAGALAAVLDDDARRAELIAAGRTNVARFSWRATATALVHALPPIARGGLDDRRPCCRVASGAARFLRGLLSIVDPADVTAVVNTGDDTTLHGLAISPDLDTITYTLAGAIDPERGWGLAGETWQAMGALARYADVRPDGSAAATTWFNLGDRDLATHLYRTARRAEGASPTVVADEVRRAWGLELRLLPMTDGLQATIIELASGEDVSFQDYFVRLQPRRRRCAACASSGDGAGPTPEVRTAIETAATIVVAPSNPIVSIGPLRALPGFERPPAGAPRAHRRRLADRRRCRPEGPRRPHARRARPRAVGRRRRPHLRPDRRRRSSSTRSTPTTRRPSRRPGCAP